MLKVYGHPASRSFRVYWTLQELNMPFEHEPYRPNEEAKQLDFLHINPNAKVPALADEGFYFFESAAIAYRICYKARSQHLLPREGSIERSQVDQWIFWCMSELEQPLSWLGKNTDHLPEHLRLTDFKKQARYEYENYKKILSQHLQHRDYLVGGSFSLADIFVAHTLNWSRSLGFLNERDATLVAYVNRMKQRPSFQRAKTLLK